MPTISLEEAQARLPEVIEKLAPGEDLVITRDARPVAHLVGMAAEKPQPIPGRGRGKLVRMIEDDEHLKDFKDYMP